MFLGEREERIDSFQSAPCSLFLWFEYPFFNFSEFSKTFGILPINIQQVLLMNRLLMKWLLVLLRLLLLLLSQTRCLRNHLLGCLLLPTMIIRNSAVFKYSLKMGLVEGKIQSCTVKTLDTKPIKLLRKGLYEMIFTLVHYGRSDVKWLLLGIQ